MSTTPGIVIAVDDFVRQQILRAVAAACRITALTIDTNVALLMAQVSLSRRLQPAVWIVDLSRLHRENVRPTDLLARLRRAHRDSEMLLSSSAQATVSALEEQWARQAGAVGLLPSLAAERIARQIDSALGQAFPALAMRSTRILASCFVRALSGGHLSRPASLIRAHHYLSQLEERNLSLSSLAEWACGTDGFAVATRRWRLVEYPSVFVGAEAVSHLSHHLACDRRTATEIGELLRQARVFRHIANAHPFEDGEFLYRFTPVTPRLASLQLVQLIELACRRKGFARSDRSYLGTRYPDCFIGGEAVAWLQARYALSEDEALLLGQALVDLGFVRHVTAAHELRNGYYFYRWRGAALAPAE